METSDKNTIAEEIRKWSNAIASRDADAVGSHYASDVVAFDLAPPLKTTGFDRKALQAWFDTWHGPIGYEIADLHISASGDLAFARSLNHMTGTKVDGENVDLWFRESYGLRKIDGHWRIAHVHESVPFYMDGSFKAAVDLKPPATAATRE